MRFTDKLFATGYRSTESVVIRLGHVRISMDPESAALLADLIRNEATYANGGEAPVAGSVRVKTEILTD